MASGHAVFKGTFDWADWLWWVATGSVALLLLLLLVCCCVCMQRAKRKGHEEALASIQSQRRRELAEQQRYQPTLRQTNVSPHRYQPPRSGTSHQRGTAVPMVPPPHRKTLGPQVAAHGNRDDPSQRMNEQFVKPYPPLPAQQVDRGRDQRRQSRDPPDRYPVPHGKEANGSSSTFGYEPHPDSIHFDASYAAGASSPVPSPWLNRPTVPKTSDGRKGLASSTETYVPAPVVAPRMTPQPSDPFEARPSGATLQARIDALRSADSRDMVHSRISFDESDERVDIDNRVSTFQARAQESYTSGSTRRSGLLMGSILSPPSTAVTSSRFTSPSNSSQSTRSYESYDPHTFTSSKSTELGGIITHGSSRSYRSDFSHSQYDDDERIAPDEGPASSRSTAMTASKQRGNQECNSVEF